MNDNAMNPKFIIGHRLFITPLQHQKIIHWGELYVVKDINESYMIRRLYPVDNNPDQIKLVSENQSGFPAIIRKCDEVLIYRVNAVMERLNSAFSCTPK